MTYSFAGFPLPEADVRAVDDGVTVMQDDGEPVTRWRTESMPPPVARCKCAHSASQHGTDRKGRFICYGSSVCGCIEFRKAAA